jgi:uncharacterized protein (TIGR00369 family)
LVGSDRASRRPLPLATTKALCPGARAVAESAAGQRVAGDFHGVTAPAVVSGHVRSVAMRPASRAFPGKPPMPTAADLIAMLEANFAPWVQELDIRIEAIRVDGVTLRVPAAERLSRVGGIVCGQAMMALADTAMALAVATVKGEFVPMTTVAQSSAFLRPATGDLLAEARIIRLGRTLVYGEIPLHTGDAGRPVAHVTSTYMLV